MFASPRLEPKKISSPYFLNLLTEKAYYINNSSQDIVVIGRAKLVGPSPASFKATSAQKHELAKCLLQLPAIKNAVAYLDLLTCK
jgi:hypothetical protein